MKDCVYHSLTFSKNPFKGKVAAPQPTIDRTVIFNGKPLVWLDSR